MMKAILIDNLIKEQAEDGSISEQITVEVDGTTMEGWQIAKPLNYDPEYTSKSDREKMAKLVLEGKAIAVQFFSDLTEEEKVDYVRTKMNK